MALSFTIRSTGDDVVKAFADEARNKTFVVTGTSLHSLGAEACLSLARAADPAALFLVSRSISKVDPVIQQVKALNPAVAVTFVECDLGDNSSVRTAAAKVNQLAASVDVLVNCAGIMGLPEYTTGASGIEMHLASSFTGHFILTNALLPKLLAARGRVVNITSQGYELSEVSYDDPNFSDERTYNPWTAYARSKTANILHAYGLSYRYKHSGLTAMAVHPGAVRGTKLSENGRVTSEAFAVAMEMGVERQKYLTGQDEFSLGPVKTLQEGVMDVLRAILDPAMKNRSPVLLWDAGVRVPYTWATSPQECDKLWDMAEKLTLE